MKSLKEDVTVESLKTVLRTDRENIFIPTSGSNLTLIKILPQLTLLVREQPESRIHLFGYPEWQTYTKDHLEAFFELDTYFYSSFYTNNLLPAAINFTKNYRRWYDKDPILSKSMSTLEKSDDETQIKVALNLIKIIIEHNISENTYSAVEDIMSAVEDGTIEKGKSRWYDIDSTVRTAINMLENLSLIHISEPTRH